MNSVTKSTSESRALATDLQNYIAAKKAYNNGNYDQALTNLNTASSSSSAIKEAYQSLRSKIAAAESSSSTTSSSAASSATSATTAAATSSSSSSAANASVAQSTSEDVIDAFATKMGFNQQGYGIIPVQKNGSVYRFEVRQNNQDNTVANLIGIYEYNAETGSVTKIS